jgi:ribA/ribD-fused uncharacterized protein
MSIKVTDTMVLFVTGWPSQWHPARFVVDGTKYTCAEQFMMSQKALMFKDSHTYRKIMKTNKPQEQKELGRSVKGFNEQIWNKRCREIVFIGNFHKFAQDPQLMKLLFETGTRTIVEASPNDRIWGIGLAIDNPNSLNRAAWRGTNWLGEALMRVRKELRTRYPGK